MVRREDGLGARLSRWVRSGVPAPAQDPSVPEGLLEICLQERWRGVWDMTHLQGRVTPQVLGPRGLRGGGRRTRIPLTLEPCRNWRRKSRGMWKMTTGRILIKSRLRRWEHKQPRFGGLFRVRRGKERDILSLE